MVAIARTGVNFADPREMNRVIGPASGLSVHDGANTGTVSTVAGFHTEIGNRGVADNTNWTATTYKTILSISSGAGYVAGMYGPTGLAGTPTTIFEITVDGVLYTVTLVATTTAQRAYIGAHMPDLNSNAGATFTSAGVPSDGADSMDASKTTSRITTSFVQLPTWQIMGLLGTPCLVFRNSLLIRMQTSENNSTTTNNERQSGVIYKVQA